MPTPTQDLTLGHARRVVAEHGFLTSAPSRPAPTSPGAARLGIEIEWHTVRTDDPERAVPFDRLESIARSIPLPGRSRLTFEPGGQVELSSQPLPHFDACRVIRSDAAALTTGLAAEGIGLVGVGLLPGPRTRVLRSPRYDAMEAHFDALGDAGRTMMRQTAAVQVNVDLGPDQQSPSRWQSAHALGPLLAAVFANSPFAASGPSGWSSTRLAVWLALEGGRSAPVGTNGGAGSAWAEYALRAPVMCIRVSDDEFVPVCEPLTFADWIVDGHELGWPTEDDLTYHLTTLFPPIRPRGWLELRMIDALPSEWFTVPAILTAALLEDSEASVQIARGLAPLAGRWADAARDGLRDADFAAAAKDCFGAARRALGRLGARRDITDILELYRERYVDRGRCPADDLLESWQTTGRLTPMPESAPAPVD
ncbi:MAG TPA: ergothioneine biosynthesis glutamate--cysteine ligase EgtA [Acidimicrobiia bacterium]|jgi:glutamate--cysteine ligase